MQTKESKFNPILVQIDDPVSEKALQVFDIYQDAFPLNERELVTDIQFELSNSRDETLVDQPTYLLAGLVYDKVVAFSIYNYNKKYNMGFISYIAIKKDFRGKGLGSWMFQENLNHLNSVALRNQTQNSPLMCWEVEKPEDSSDLGEQEIRKKRIKFYEKNGGISLSHIEYIAPPLRKELQPVAYYLMYHPVNNPQLTLTPNLLHAIVDFTLLLIYEVSKESIYYKNAVASIYK